MENEELLVCATVLLASSAAKIKLLKPCKKRTIWVKSWLAERENRGVYNNLLQELKCTDRENYRKYLRMNTETFQVRKLIYCIYKTLTAT